MDIKRTTDHRASVTENSLIKTEVDLDSDGNEIELIEARDMAVGTQSINETNRPTSREAAQLNLEHIISQIDKQKALAQETT